jgi:nitrogen fixation/metabolism regulation signal transduction histidine kinase
MGFKSRFAFGLAIRAVALLLAAFAFVQTLYMPGLGAARIVAALLCLAAGAMLWRYIQRTNRELARFIDAVRFGDLGQGFAHRWAGSGFAELGEALDQGIRRLRDERHALSDANRFYEAVLDDAPIALLVVEGDGKVELANKASRRLFVRIRASGSRISPVTATPSPRR